jgi:hypothetical protein
VAGADTQCLLTAGATLSCVNPGATTGTCGFCKNGPDGGFCFSTPAGSSGITSGFGMAMLYVAYNAKDSAGVPHPTIDLVCEHDFVPTVNAVNSGKDCAQLAQPFASIDLANTVNYVPVAPEATPTKVKSISVDAVLGDLYIEVEDANGSDELLEMFANDLSVRNVHEVWLDQKVAQVCSTSPSGCNVSAGPCPLGQTCSAAGQCVCTSNANCSPISTCINGGCIPNSTFADEARIAAEGWSRIVRLGLPTNEGMLNDPGFENTNFTTWSASATGGAQVQSSSTRHSGTTGFAIGSQPGSLAGQSKLARSFTVSTVGKSQFSVWVNRIATNLPMWTWQQAGLQNAAGNSVATLYPLGAYNDGAGVWHFYNIDVTPFAGQTLTVVFLNTKAANNSDQVWTFVDDAVLTNEGSFNEIPMLR